MKTPAQVMVDAAAQTAAGNAPQMNELASAMRDAERNATGKKAPSMLTGVSGATWALLAKSGPIAQGTATQGHRRFLKGLLPRLPQADADKVRAILAHYSFKL